MLSPALGLHKCIERGLLGAFAHDTHYSLQIWSLYCILAYETEHGFLIAANVSGNGSMSGLYPAQQKEGISCWNCR